MVTPLLRTRRARRPSPAVTGPPSPTLSRPPLCPPCVKSESSTSAVHPPSLTREVRHDGQHLGNAVRTTGKQQEPSVALSRERGGQNMFVRDDGRGRLLDSFDRSQRLNEGRQLLQALKPGFNDQVEGRGLHLKDLLDLRKAV
jgi:hypothetical protein